MIDAQHKGWRIIRQSVRGAAHEKMSRVNQDAIASQPKEAFAEVPLIISLADGHGSAKHFHSDIGAKIAVQITNDILYQFATESTHSSFANIEFSARRLPYQILSEWKKKVEQHWEVEHHRENAECGKEVKRQFHNPDIFQIIETHPIIAYGTTLLSVLVTEHFILYMQIGDGDIITITADGEIAEPVPPDERNFANEATSLCSPTAVQDFRIELQGRTSNEPALIMLASDGYTNSFTTREGFLQVGADIWQMIHSNGEAGLSTIEENLESWLKRTTELGSGDDISVGLLCRLSALRPEEPKMPLHVTPSLPIATTPAPFEEGTIRQEIPGTAINEQELDLPTEKRPGGEQIIIS